MEHEITFTNRDLYSPTSYFFRGYISLSTDEDNFNQTVDFDNGTLIEMYREVYKWYVKTINSLEKLGGWNLPFSSPKDYKSGVNSKYTIVMSLVEVSEGIESEYDINEGSELNEDTIELIEHLINKL